jgi:hypothetical protein
MRGWKTRLDRLEVAGLRVLAMWFTKSVPHVWRGAAVDLGRMGPTYMARN